MTPPNLKNGVFAFLAFSPYPPPSPPPPPPPHPPHTPIFVISSIDTVRPVLSSSHRIAHWVKGGTHYAPGVYTVDKIMRSMQMRRR